ncbi:MAG TPA: hypothetical protein VK253_04340, partial [Candidatus Binatia bacterium]|nr:hypothetical protein [Candidatus Binatia bacterium]
MNNDGPQEEHSQKKKRSKDTLTASGIAEYIRFNCCPRFFKLRLKDDPETENPKWPIFKPISPLLYGVGKNLEEKKVAELKEKAADYQNFENREDSCEKLRQLIEAQISSGERADSKPILLYQVPMNGQIGVWKIKGIADLIAIWPLKDGKAKVRIFELKSSWL